MRALPLSEKLLLYFVFLCILIAFFPREDRLACVPDDKRCDD
jgi:hypothetical protein